MNILVFAPIPSRSRDNESLILKWKENGHNVRFLNLYANTPIENYLSEKGIPCDVLIKEGKSAIKLIKSVLFLIKYIRKNKIDLVFSHLDPANLISVLAQYFVNARIIIVRHYVDELHLTGGSKALSYKMIYQLAKEIIVVSNRAKEFMINEEKVDGKKVSVIKLAYDFKLFDTPNSHVVINLKKGKENQLILLTACRLVSEKRPELSIEVAYRLKQKKIPFHLFIVGAGDLLDSLKNKVINYNLTENITITGFQSNIMDYIEASDILLNPSLVDSSSVIIKEAGYRKKAVIVCKKIGDCDEYITDCFNGFLTDAEHFTDQAVNVICRYYDDIEHLSVIGKNLNEKIIELLDVNKNIYNYDQILNK